MQLPDGGLLEFPCELSVKAMGAAEADFQALVLEIVRRHVPGVPEAAARSRPSRAGNYLAVTVTFTAHSRRQLDDLYRELSAHQRVLVAL